VQENSSVNAAAAASTESDSLLSTAHEFDSIIGGPSVNGKENELTNLENASEATDSGSCSEDKQEEKKKKKKEGQE
jgi:hypothetical protein